MISSQIVYQSNTSVHGSYFWKVVSFNLIEVGFLLLLYPISMSKHFSSDLMKSEEVEEDCCKVIYSRHCCGAPCCLSAALQKSPTAISPGRHNGQPHLCHLQKTDDRRGAAPPLSPDRWTHWSRNGNSNYHNSNASSSFLRWRCKLYLGDVRDVLRFRREERCRD